MSTTNQQMCIEIRRVLLQEHSEKHADVRRIREMCMLYLPPEEDDATDQARTALGSSNDSEQLYQPKDMFFDSPKFQPYQESNIDSLKSTEFLNKHTFFVRVIYICLQLGISIFASHKSGAIVLLSYRELKLKIYARKKELIGDHILILKKQQRAQTHDYTSEYVPYCQDYQRSMDTIHKILRAINDILAKGIASEQDNLLSMLLPYFRAKERFIEKYN